MQKQMITDIIIGIKKFCLYCMNIFPDKIFLFESCCSNAEINVMNIRFIAFYSIVSAINDAFIRSRNFKAVDLLVIFREV